MYWYEHYIGKPWVDIPTPPISFTCGELMRYILKNRLGIDNPPILADGSKLRQCLANLAVPEAYGLYPFEGPPRPFDMVYLMRRVRRDHIAMAVKRGQDLLFLHCVQGAGVILETEFELKANTFSNFMEWRRHKDVTEEMVKCLA